MPTLRSLPQEGKNSREHGQDSVQSVPADKHSQHLIRSIVIAAVVVALVVVGIAGFALYTEYRANIEATEQRAESRVAVFHEHLKLAIGSLDAVMQAIADKIRADDFSGESFHASLIRMKAEMPILRVLLAVDEHGLIINESRDPYEARGTNVADRLYFNKHLEPDVRGVYIGPPVMSRIDGKWALPISRGVRDEDGSFRGVAVASISPYYFSDMFTAMDFGTDYAGFLTHTDGTVIALFPYDDTRIGTSVANSELFRRHLPTAGQGVFQERDPSDGITRIVAYRLIDPWPLAVSFSIPMQDGLAPFYRMAVIWAIVIAFVLLVIIFATRYQIGQILKLSEQAATLQRTTDDLRMGITQLRQAEEAVRESEERYRTLLELGERIGEAVVMLQDDERGTGMHTFVSDQWPHITGYSREELLNMSMADLIHPKDREMAVERHERRIRGEVLPGLYEITIVRKDGTEVPVEVVYASTQYKGKAASVGYIRDITDRKKMEEQLIVTDRLVSIGELASGIAHELNNPLTSVIGFSDLLLGKKYLPDDVKEDLGVVNREAKRTAQVVRNLLTFARKHEAEKKAVDIHGIIKLVLELRAYEQKLKNIKVHTRFASSLPEIIADGFQLQQVFLNIIINAEHFMTEEHGRGTLTITTERAGDIIRASFADDGPGIAKRNLGHLFDPFFTTKEVGKGTGLGLSISYGIITEHGGRIYAESKLGKGATFIVEFPISQ